MGCIARIRKVFMCLGFLFLFLWILFGNYDTGRSQRKRSVEKELWKTTDNNINRDDDCSSIHDHDEDMHCEFVKRVSACGSEGGHIPYFEFVYCVMPPKLISLSMIILSFWLIYLFIFLGTTAEEFLCRDLVSITQILRLSPNVAGVTLLALGNGAPDIFSTLAAFTHSDDKKSSLAFGALFGAGMFVTTVVVGLVALFKPFTLTHYAFMRDNIYYLGAVFWVFYLLWDNHMDILVAIGLIILYLSYVLLVVLGSIIYNTWVAWRIKRNEQVKDKKPTEVIAHYKTRKHEDSLGETQSEEIILYTDKEEDRKSPVAPKIIVTTQEKQEEEDYDTDDLRPKTPNERSASRATQAVYGVSEDEEDEMKVKDEKLVLPIPKQYDSSSQASTPRPRSRIEKVIDNAVYLAEDMLVGTGPNLAKMWHQAYEKEKEEEKSRHTTPVHIDKETSFQTSSSLSSSSENEENEDDVEPSEETPLLKPEKSSSAIMKKVFPPAIKLLKALFPFREECFRSLNIVKKIYLIIKFPLTFMLVLTIPVVDKNEPLNNWNRWLNIIHCVSAPVFISLTIKNELIMINDVFPLVVIVFFAFLILAVVVALTSSDDKQPCYHCLFAWAGFGISIFWIYTIANEIVNLLQVFGIVVKLSDGILGITLLAWGNSIQDSVTNVTMARQGFPRMAVGACFGGPLLNILIGIGLASIVKSLEKPNQEFRLYFTQVQMFAAFFLLFCLASSLVMMSCLRFRMSRVYGVCLFILYLFFIVVIILAETKILFDIKIDGVLTDID